MTRNSHQDSISVEQFERLLETARNMPAPYGEECEFILLAAGRLGMRAGELCHLRPSWINTERSQVEIPTHDPCTKGDHDTICGYCTKQAFLAAENDPDLNPLEAMERRWEPKTEHAIRTIPYDFEEELAERFEELALDGGYRKSRVSVNRRVTRVAEKVGMNPSKLYPHALRATAATHLAYRGLSAPALQAFMGWAKIAAADKYVRLSGEQTAKALRRTYDRD